LKWYAKHCLVHWTQSLFWFDSDEKKHIKKGFLPFYCSGLLVIKAVYLDGFGRMRLVVPLLLFGFHGLKEIADKT